jgi:hypothetical protein
LQGPVLRSAGAIPIMAETSHMWGISVIIG